MSTAIELWSISVKVFSKLTWDFALTGCFDFNDFEGWIPGIGSELCDNLSSIAVPNFAKYDFEFVDDWELICFRWYFWTGFVKQSSSSLRRLIISRWGRTREIESSYIVS